MTSVPDVFTISGNRERHLISKVQKSNTKLDLPHSRTVSEKKLAKNPASALGPDLSMDFIHTAKLVRPIGLVDTWYLCFGVSPGLGRLI